MPPGSTQRPAASISSIAVPRSVPRAAMRPSRIPISAMKTSAAVAQRALRMMRSKLAMSVRLLEKPAPAAYACGIDACHAQHLPDDHGRRIQDGNAGVRFPALDQVGSPEIGAVGADCVRPAAGHLENLLRERGV